MRIFDIFKQKETEGTLRELLGNDTVKQVLNDFIEEHLATADSIVILWSVNQDVSFDFGGLSEIEVYGLLQAGILLVWQKGGRRQ